MSDDYLTYTYNTLVYDSFSLCNADVVIEDMLK